MQFQLGPVIWSYVTSVPRNSRNDLDRSFPTQSDELPLRRTPFVFTSLSSIHDLLYFYLYIRAIPFERLQMISGSLYKQDPLLYTDCDRV